MRLLSGVCATLPFPTELDGDASLRSRPMGRVVEPLRRMGAAITAADGEHPPLADSPGCAPRDRPPPKSPVGAGEGRGLVRRPCCRG